MGSLFALVFRSTALARRHAAHRRGGGTSDFAVYRPHVSFAVRDRRSLAGIRPYDGPLLFGSEEPGW